MKEEIKKEWVDALRSGEYAQGKCSLREGDKFCCLGVLTDLAVKKGIGKWVDDKYYNAETRDSAAVILPVDIIKWSGIINENPYVKRKEDYLKRTLAGINDSGVSFSEIADIIEEQL